MIDALERAGQLIYGEFWKANLSHDAAWDLRLVQRIAAGQYDCPPFVLETMAALARARAAALRAFAAPERSPPARIEKLRDRIADLDAAAAILDSAISAVRAEEAISV